MFFMAHDESLLLIVCLIDYCILLFYLLFYGMCVMFSSVAFLCFVLAFDAKFLFNICDLSLKEISRMYMCYMKANCNI